MRRSAIISVLVVCAGVLIHGCHPGSGQDLSGAWSRASEILGQIQAPDIPDTEFRLGDFGGVGNGIRDNRPAFDRAIEACVSAGGGTLVVGPGEYLVNGPIQLKSHMELRLEEGARLVFGNDPADYLPVVLTSWEGTRCYNYSPFIYALRATDFAITGKGEIDGSGSDPWNGWKDLQGPDQKLIRAMNNEGVPLEERVFGEGHYLRPHLVQFYQCDRVRVEDVKISDSPFWCLHFVYSRNITVRGVEYAAFNFNNDGIDPESSENILIENVTFNNRDDNIAIKAGRDLEARTLGIPSRNILVRNCRFRGHNALAVGSEMSGGVHDVYAEDCSFAGPVVYGFYLKGNRDRGGVVRDIYARNLEFDSTRATIIIDSDYKNEGSCCPPAFRNIHVEGVRSAYAGECGILLKGSPQMHLDSVFLSDVEILSAAVPVEITNTDFLYAEDVRINGDPGVIGKYRRR
jgi:polygalacturonase